jgi:signal transduction histidine kinase
MKSKPLDDSFIRNLSHDILNPLSSINGFLDLVLAPDNKDPLTLRQRRMLSSVNRACTHLLGTIRDLSDLSRLEEKLWTPVPIAVDLRAAAEGRMEEYRLLTDHRRVAMTVQSETVSADKAMIERFFDVLLRASESLTPEGGHIVLRLASLKGKVTGTLENDGEEKSPSSWNNAFKAKVFGPRPAEGYAAMGMALAQRIALLHGGSLRVESSLGGGTAFHFVFPRDS